MKSKSEGNLPVIKLQNIMKPEKRKEKENHAKMNSLVKSLEYSLYESQKRGQQSDNKLDEAKKENKTLLNVLQQQCDGHDMPRSQVDLASSCSTVSMVHLQYKYEELLSSHEGLLRLLESKVREVRKCYAENEKLSAETKAGKESYEELQRTLKMVCEKYFSMKKRKDEKIKQLKFQRETLKLAHDKLVFLLHEKCMENDEALLQQLGKSSDCLKSLLINEIRRANKLQYENVILKQKNAYLNSKLGPINN